MNKYMKRIVIIALAALFAAPDKYGKVVRDVGVEVD